MKTLARLLGLSLLLVTQGCPPPPPTPAPATATSTGGVINFTATVTTSGSPPTWQYTVSGVPMAGGQPSMMAIELITSIDLSRCVITPPTYVSTSPSPPHTVNWTIDRTTGGDPIGVKAPAGVSATAVTFTVECDAVDGPVYRKVDRGGGAIIKTIGPIRGPT